MPGIDNQPPLDNNQILSREQHEQVEHYQPDTMLDTAGEQKLTQILQQIFPKLLEDINVNAAASIPADKLNQQLGPILDKLLQTANIDLSKLEQTLLQQKLLAEMTGFGPIEPLLKDKSVSDILVNDATTIYVERFGKLYLTPARFFNSEHILKTLNRILLLAGRRIDETTPFVDTSLPDGSRVNAIIPPLTKATPILSIRKFAYQKLTIDDLINNGTLTRPMADLLQTMLACRLNILITGGTGSGKTTLLNALAQSIDPNERIITIEDVYELKLAQPHVISLITRPANIDGKLEVNQRMLFKNSLRMRPNRIIIGEVRGAEVFDMLQAMNTGHDGSLSTVHASSVREAFNRLTNMISLTGFNYSTEAMLEQIISCIHVIVELSRLSSGQRVITNISEINNNSTKAIDLHNIYQYQYQTQANAAKFQFNGISKNLTAIFARHGYEAAILDKKQ